MTLCEKLPYACVESDSYIIKTHFKGYKLLEMAHNIYSYIIKGLLHWCWWILSLVCKLASFDIPTRDSIHQYQCNNPILWCSVLAAFCNSIQDDELMILQCLNNRNCQNVKLIETQGEICHCIWSMILFHCTQQFLHMGWSYFLIKPHFNIILHAQQL